MISDRDCDLRLELSGWQFRQLVDLAMEHIVAHIDSLPEQHAWNSDGAADLARSVIEPLPTDGSDAADIFQKFFGRYLATTYNTASPGYMAFVPGGGLPQSAVADLIAGVINRYVGVWIAAPALAQIETTVIRWFCDIVGYPKQGGGFLTTGGSLANWSGLVTARRCRLPDDFQSGLLYTSNQAHYSVQKAAMLAGFPTKNVCEIAVDSQFRVRVDLLAEQIAADRALGRTPFAIVGHAGTVNTGAVDALDALADLADQEGLWLHVDAAYGGFFMLTERGQRLMKGIERADSIALDPHKGLFLPFGNGCLLVRNLDHLKQAHSLTGEYMPPMQDEPDFVDFCQISPELSRDFRGLRTWLPIKMHGIEPFRNNLNEKLDLTRWAVEQLRSINNEIDDELEIVAEPQLSIVAFRLLRQGLDEPQLTRLNEDLREKINRNRRVYLTPTILDGRYVIRICVIQFRTHLARMKECLQEIRKAIGKVS